ncbi:hypothetical protein, partial [Actinophytocola sp.]|jgi:hypothetical protein|uniref:hypothetical protein n=1 Tax=Actinophytocola sp. TaxID=1872138 RepID=UPI002ED784CA
MAKLWVILLASSPFLGFLLWAGWWLISDALRERRRVRVAVRIAARYARGPDERGGHGQAPAA